MMKNKYKRDFYLKRSKDLEIKFYKRPFKEIIWWVLYFFDFLLFRISPKLHSIINGNFHVNNNKNARDRTDYLKSIYAETDHRYFEIQVMNHTRISNILSENEEIIYKRIGEEEFFLFGATPLIEESHHNEVIEWSLNVLIIEDDKEKDLLSFVFPYNTENRNDNFIYKIKDGWVNFKIDLKKYKKNNLIIKICPSLKKIRNKNYKSQFSLSNPQFRLEENGKKNILLLSIESLSDLKFLSRKYNYSIPKNLENLMKDSYCYDKVYSPVDSTLPHAASITSGLYASQHGIGDYSVGADTYHNKTINGNVHLLQKVMKKNNFLTFFAGTSARFNSKGGHAKGFDDHYQINNNFENNPLKMSYLVDTIDSFKDFNNFFLFHLDYLHAPMLSFDQENSLKLHEASLLDTKNDKLAENLYFNGLEKVDRDIGELIKYLKSSNQYENTMIILTGDHGSGVNWEKNSNYSLYDERIRVPLIVKHPIWSNEIIKPNKIVNSIQEINKIITFAIGEKISDQLKNLPQYSRKYNNFAIAETIMNPSKDKKKHCLALMNEKYKYICWNHINWDNYSISNKLEDKLFRWNELNDCYDETNDIKEENEKEYKSMKQNAYDIIEENLKFLEKYPNEQY